MAGLAAISGPLLPWATLISSAAFPASSYTQAPLASMLFIQHTRSFLFQGLECLLPAWTSPGSVLLTIQVSAQMHVRKEAFSDHPN